MASMKSLTPTALCTMQALEASDGATAGRDEEAEGPSVAGGTGGGKGGGGEEGAQEAGVARSLRTQRRCPKWSQCEWAGAPAGGGGGGCGGGEAEVRASLDVHAEQISESQAGRPQGGREQ